MSQLVVQDLDRKLTSLLQKQADAHGVSPEEELGHILKAGLVDQPEEFPDLMAVLLEMPEGLTASDLARSRDLPREIDLS